MTFTTGNFHDKELLEKASSFLSKSNTNKDSLQYLLNLEKKHIKYIDNQCVNLIAAESPTSPLVQKCLSSKLGYRASGGHIGKTSRCFPSMNFLDYKYFWRKNEPY